MIKTKNVIRMKIPFPGINDQLAVKAHMYICESESFPKYFFVKCQTLKPWMLTSSVFRHYIDESADITRNPFVHTTRIDCDKMFLTENVQYDDHLLTPLRPDICDELYNSIYRELFSDKCDIIKLDKNKLTAINILIT